MGCPFIVNFKQLQCKSVFNYIRELDWEKIALGQEIFGFGVGLWIWPQWGHLLPLGMGLRGLSLSLASERPLLRGSLVVSPQSSVRSWFFALWVFKLSLHLPQRGSCHFGAIHSPSESEMEHSERRVTEMVNSDLTCCPHLFCHLKLFWKSSLFSYSDVSCHSWGLHHGAQPPSELTAESEPKWQGVSQRKLLWPPKWWQESTEHLRAMCP